MFRMPQVVPLTNHLMTDLSYRHLLDNSRCVVLSISATVEIERIAQL